jgi:protein TonB
MRPRPRRQNPEQTMSDVLDLEQKPSRRLWLFAGVAALALHLGGAALAITQLQTTESDYYSEGTGTIEVGIEASTKQTEETDLPPGPDSDASVASPALAEQQAEVKDSDLPKEIPTEEAEADRMVTPNDIKKPVEEDAKVAKVQTQASQESVAAEATATPVRLEKARRERTTWQKELMAHLDRHKRYPTERLTKGAEITVSFELDRMGHVLSASIVKGSGDAAFDQAALAMLHRSDPVPRPPPLVADEGLNFTLPVIFKVKSKS